MLTCGENADIILAEFIPSLKEGVSKERQF